MTQTFFITCHTHTGKTKQFQKICNHPNIAVCTLHSIYFFNWRMHASTEFPIARFIQKGQLLILDRFPDLRLLIENGNYCWRIISKYVVRTSYFYQAESILGTRGKKLCHGTKTRLKLRQVSRAI